MALAQDEQKNFRMYSMSAQINADRDEYYDILEKTQREDGEITDWLLWFLQCFNKTIQRSEGEVKNALLKVSFRTHLATVEEEDMRKQFYG